MEEEISNLMKWMSGEKTPPVIIELLFGDGCNQNCKFCASHNGENRPLGQYEMGDKLTEHDYLRLIKESAELGVNLIQLSGDGEPLFDKKKAMTVMREIKKYNMSGRINTNGVLFTEDDIKTLVEIDWDFIIFSVESPDAATHDDLVNLPGAFDRVIHNVKRFNYWKKKLKKDKPEMEFKMILTNKNYRKLEEMVILSHKLNVNLRLDSLIIFHDFGNLLKLSKKQETDFKKYLNRAMSLSKKSCLRFNVSNEILSGVYSKKTNYNDLKNLQFPKLKSNRFLSSSCYLPWLRMLIGTTGFVGPCGFFMTKDNINNKTLKEIWFGRTYNKLRRDRLNQKLGKFCSFCGDIEYNCFIRDNLNKQLSE